MKKFYTIVLLLIVVLGVSGCSISFNNKKEECPKCEECSTNIKQEVKVETGVNFTDGYWHKFVAKIPKIVNGGVNAEKLNEAMINEIVPSIFFEVDDEIPVTKNGRSSDYEYVIKNGVIAIYAYTKFNSNEPFPGSGDGTTRFNYFYEIATDKILTFEEGLKLLNIELNKCESGNCSFVLVINSGKLHVEDFAW